MTFVVKELWFTDISPQDKSAPSKKRRTKGRWYKRAQDKRSKGRKRAQCWRTLDKTKLVKKSSKSTPLKKMSMKILNDDNEKRAHAGSKWPQWLHQNKYVGSVNEIFFTAVYTVCCSVRWFVIFALVFGLTKAKVKKYKKRLERGRL